MRPWRSSCALRAAPSQEKRSVDIAVGRFLDHRGGEIIGEADDVAGFDAACAFDESAPRAAAAVEMQRHLDGRRAARAGQPRRDDARVVRHQHIAGAQQLRQIADTPVGDAIAYHEQPSGIARLDRMFGDELARQVEIEFVDAHCRCV